MSIRSPRLPLALLLGLALALLPACSSTGASVQVVGGARAPQAPLVECIAEAQGEIAQARSDFDAAFQLYQRLTSPQAVELDGLSKGFGKAIGRCDERREEIDERVDDAHDELEDLLRGWGNELERFSSDTMRKKSEAMLRDTEARATRVQKALERLQARMGPVCLKLQDYALFFRHNLSPRAIATLEDTYKDFDAEFHALEAEFGKAATEIEGFLREFTVAPESPSAPAVP